MAPEKALAVHHSARLEKRAQMKSEWPCPLATVAVLAMRARSPSSRRSASPAHSHLRPTLLALLHTPLPPPQIAPVPPAVPAGAATHPHRWDARASSPAAARSPPPHTLAAAAPPSSDAHSRAATRSDTPAAAGS